MQSGRLPVPRVGWFLIALAACALLPGCNKYQRKKPDATKGVVAGIVYCADTGKPARFATVLLTAAPKEGEKSDQGDPLPAAETTVTDLEGRFRMEAVQPGRYYAFATQDGYLDPALALDPEKLKGLPSDRDRHLYSIKTWKDNLVEVTVSVRRVAEVSLQIQRAAAITGTVGFDDASPAIGMRFSAFPQDGQGSMERGGAGVDGHLGSAGDQRQPRHVYAAESHGGGIYRVHAPSNRHRAGCFAGLPGQCVPAQGCEHGEDSGRRNRCRGRHCDSADRAACSFRPGDRACRRACAGARNGAVVVRR